MGEVSTIGLDIATSVFQVHGVDDAGLTSRDFASQSGLSEFRRIELLKFPWNTGPKNFPPTKVLVFSRIVTAKKGDAVMRFVLCVLSIALLPSFAFAAKGTMSLSEAQAAAAKGDADAAAAIMMTTDRQVCLNECARRGHNKEQCTSACRPGLCHPGAEQPYCIAK